MKGIKKTLCLLLSLVMILSMGVPAFAFDNATSEAQANTTSSETSPFSIELSTDKSSYSATGIAKITAKVTNTSGKDIKDVSAEAVFGELAPCKKKSSQTTAEAETLKDGESLEFTYSATINKNAKKLNIFEKIILFFVRLFNGGYSAKDNGFDNGREFVESSNDIKFGKRWARNTVKVWFGESDTNITDMDWFEGVDDNHVVTLPTGEKYIDNRIIVYFFESATNEQKTNVVKFVNGKIIGNNNDLQYQVELENVLSIDELRQICNSVEKFEGVFCCFYESIINLGVSQIIPNDPWKDNLFTNTDWNENNPSGLNWWLETIKMPSAWEYNNRFSNIKIGVADTGFDTAHEDLNINCLNSNQNIKENHGTHVSGIIGATANNQLGVSGIVWNKELYGVDVIKTKEQKENNVSVLNVYQGIQRLLEEGCKVVNVSLGAVDPINDENTIRDEGITSIKNILYWLNEFKNKDFVIVQGAGNYSVDCEKSGIFASVSLENIEEFLKDHKDNYYQYSIDDVLSHIIIVGAIDKPSTDGSYKLTDLSNYGSNVSIVAPGEKIYSTIAGVKDTNWSISEGQKYANLSGTSMATPMVTGVASLVWSVNPNFTAKEVKNIVCQSYDKTANPYHYPADVRTYPIVNAKLAVEEAIKQTDDRGTAMGAFVDKDTKEHINNVKMKCIKYTGNIKYSSLSDFDITTVDGIFYQERCEGIYEYKIQADGYTYGSTIILNIKKGKALDIGTIELIKTNKKGTKIQGCVRDSETKAPIANAKVELRDGTNFNVMHDVNGKYHASDFEDYKVLSTTTTDENGKYTFNMPSGKYVVAVYHDDYEFNGLYFSFEKNLDGYFPADILLIPNGDGDDGDDDRPVTASGNCGADGDNVKWVLYDDGELKISGQGEIKNFTSRSSSPWYKYAYSTIKKVIIKHGITSIGDYSFDNCRNLTHITLPNTITQIGKLCFRDCGKLTSIEIPESVKSIGERCFFRCDSLATINIPYSITNIGYYAFDECENLEYINVDVDNQNYCSLDGVLFNKNKTELIQYTIGNERKEYVVPIGVTYIWSLAFYGCDNLLKINLPNTLVKIGDATFYGCKNLNYINIPNGVKYIGTNFLGLCHSLERIFIPSSVTYIGSFAFENNKGLLSIDVDKNNLNYSSEEGVLFSKDKSQLIRYPEGNKTTEYVIPNNVIYVHSDAFRYCSNIESVTIPKNVKAIYRAAFSDCTKLKNIKMENGLESIGEFSFQNCDSLEKIEIPSSVTYIGDYAFSFCDNLKSVTINNSNCTIYNDGYTISNTATIYGYKNSTAQAYAEKYNRTFIPLTK